MLGKLERVWFFFFGKIIQVGARSSTHSFRWCAFSVFFLPTEMCAVLTAVHEPEADDVRVFCFSSLFAKKNEVDFWQMNVPRSRC